MSGPGDRFDEKLDSSGHVAIVALSGRFPGAQTAEDLWPIVEAGEERVVDLTEDDLRASGVEDASLADPRYVRRTGLLADIERFDAGLFGYSPGEAARIDPQQRLFLEHAWEAFEAAGYDVRRVTGPVGVFAGTSTNGYFFFHFFSPRELLNSPGADAGWLTSGKDFLATRVSYELGLRGPGLTVQTACSTSLVAVHLACQSLLAGECDMALAGGVSVRVPQAVGYFHQPESILSPDGRCRAYDAAAAGTVVGSGVGAVVLKRSSDAVADGDPIRAVILASAINNDGHDKIGFTAPGVEGQAAVVGDALALAGIDPASVGYVEGHGSGTRLGDPIEVSALNQAYELAAGRTLPRASCVLGSVKSNIGHLDAAAGIAGLIKTVLALEHGRLPPTAHFRTPSPRIDFEGGPFHVLSAVADWPRGDRPRRAGVSSFGLGGTNAHLVLQEAPERGADRADAGNGREAGRREQLLVLSAATASAADRAAERLADWLEAHPEASPADVAFTLQTGRAVLPHRRAVVVGEPGGAPALLRGGGDESGIGPGRVMTAVEERRARPVSFLLPGLGEEYWGLGRRLYDGEPVFRESIDRAARLVRRETGADLLVVIRAEPPAAAPGETGAGGLDLRSLLGRAAAEPALPVTVAHPALFAVEHALAELWRSWGVAPDALLGYSLGEYVAACLAGTIPFEQAVGLVARRAELVAALPPGAMLAVPLPEEEVARRIAETGAAPEELGIGAVNGPGLTVVAGTPERVEAFERALAGQGHACRRLATGHAFHTAALEPAADGLRRLLEGVDLAPPEVPFLSNLTGTWVRDEEATDPDHWVRTFLRPVRFAAGLAELARDPARVFLEVGPGSTLGSLAIQADHIAPGAGRSRVAVASLPGRHERRGETEHLLAAAGRLWLAGADLDWTGLHGGPRRRLDLPTYPFERRRYWVETVGRPAAAGVAVPAAGAPWRDAETKSVEVHARPGLTTPYEAPRTDLERELADLWGELLGIDRIGRRDSFFELGGHSLMATQLVARLAARHGVELTLVRFFEIPTVAALAEWLAGEVGEAGEASAAGLAGDAEAAPRAPSPLRRPPLSFAQQRAWLMHRLDPDDPSYNIPNVLRLSGRIDPPAMRDALRRLGERHESLRTTFGEDEEGSPFQAIAERPSVALPVVDLSGLPEGAREAEARRASAAEVARPFDLAAGPMVRTLLIRTTSSSEEHLFLVTFHHANADGWSLGVFVRELAALYEGRSLPPLPIQYADFALWQRERLRGERLDRLLGYWRESLAGAPRALELPTDRPRPAVQGHRGRQVAVRLEPALLEPLLAVGRERGATPFMTLLAAFLVLLHRWSGAGVLPVGTPIANRTRPEHEGLIGFFTNTLVMVGDVTGAPSFAELLARVRTAALGAYDHQDLPFERLVEELEPARDLSRPPLFQVMFALQNAPREALRAAGATIEPVPLDPETAKFDLTLQLHEESGGGLRGDFEYATDLFDRTTAQRLAALFRTLVAAAAAEPGRRVVELPWLPPALRHQVIHEWAPGRAGVSAHAPGLVHAPVAAAARRAPDAVALVSGQRHLSYDELLRRAAALAAVLRVHCVEGAGGARARPVVAIELARSAEASIALLAVLRAGAAYLPIAPEDPEERRRALLEDAGATIVVGAQGRIERRSGSAPEASAPAGPREPTPDDLAYVLYTSGSTGRPKGVAMPHRALASLIAWQRERSVPAPPGRATAQLAPLGFDVSCQETFAAWSEGGRLVLVPEPARRDPAALLDLLGRHRVERLFLPFVVLASLSREAAESGGLPRSLTEVVTAGERLRVDDAVRRAFAGGGPRLDNQYGPTETHVATARALAGDPAGWPELPPIGRPVARARALVLGPGLRAAPPGSAGELLLGGACLARGYLGRPGFTAERFVPDPFAAGAREAGSRLYRTGDLARHRADGTLEFLGRRDDQVKVRGYRIEPAEVEAALVTHPAIADAAVAARGEGVDARLVAYAVRAAPAGAGAPDEGDLVAYLRGLLPEPLVPGRVVLLDRFPTLPSGKVDRRALPPPEAIAGGAAGAFVPPRTSAEERMAALWRELLEVERVGAGDGFFALGGHSLLAARLASRVRAAFGVELPLRRIFERPGLGELTAEVLARAEGGGAGAGDAIPVLPRDPDGGAELPASPAQEGLWLVERLRTAERGAAYHLGSALRLTGPLALRGVRAGIERAVARHEVLRTRLVERAGRPVQRVGPPGRRALPVVDLSGLPEARRERELTPLLEDASARPFDLADPAEGGLLRAVLVREDGRRHVLLLTLHHAVGDGWSLPILVDEMVAGYRDEPAPPPLPVQYGDFAAWQRERLEGDRLEAGLRRLRERLAGAPTELELPRDRPRRPDGLAGSRRAAVLPVRVEAPAVDALRALAREEGATLFMGLLALFQLVVGRWSGRDDLLVGAPVANRARPEVEPLIGLFVNVLVLRGRLEGIDRGGAAGRGSFRDLLAGARDDALAAYADQEIPYERLVEELRPKRESDRNPLVQAVLAYRGRSPEAATLGEVALEPLRLRPAAAKFDLLLEVEEGPDGLAGVIEYPAESFDPTTVRRFRSHFLRLVDRVTAGADRPLAEIGLMTPGERQAVLVEWRGPTSAPDPDAPAEDSLIALFRHRVARAPESVALVSSGAASGPGGGHLTYRALARRADALTGRLRAAGVAPGEPVAVMLDRSIEAVTAILAVLAAGAAYVPLDPATPEPRVRDLAAEVGLRRAVTDAASRPLAEAVGLAPIDVAGPAPAEAEETPGVAAPEAGSSGQALAYVVFTSGSTGRPKAVGATHEGVTRLIRDPGHARMGPGASFLLLAPLAFDASTLEIWGALARGGRLVIAPAGPRSMSEIAALLDAERITSSWLTTGLFHQMAEAEAETLTRVPVVMTGGDVVSPGQVARHLERVARAGFGGRDGGALIHAYGPTEATTFTTVRRLRPGDPERTPLPLGRPIQGTRVTVGDTGLRPAPIGVPGELLIGGVALARGYLGRPAVTAERFVPDPFADGPDEAGGRLYRSGDLARVVASGELEFLGRIDDQVKVRGFRVEPGEVEAALAEHPGVARAVVVLVRGRPAARGTAREDRLVAYWVPAASERSASERSGAERRPDARALRRHLEARLPRPIVPSEYVAIETLPLTVNGKIDRAALPEPDGTGRDRAVGEAGTGAPWQSLAPVLATGDVRATLAALWTEILGEPPAGGGPGGNEAERDFFESGGHSLLATRLLARVRQVLGVELPLRTLFESPTFGGLLAAVEAVRPAPAGPEIASTAATAATADGPHDAPLSFAQERLWLVDRMTGDGPGGARGGGGYNIPAAMRLDGRLDLAALAGAFRTIEARHDALRTRFEERRVAGSIRPVQVVTPHRPGSPALPMVDLSGLAEEARIETELERLAADHAWLPFDLATGPLWRVLLVRLRTGVRMSSGHHAVLCTLHHVVSDGWSVGVLIRELAAGYRARAAGYAAVAPEPLPLQYPEVARRQRRELEGGVLDRLLDGWSGRLAGAPAILDLPTDRPRPPRPALRGRGVRRLVPRPVLDRLVAVGREGRATLFMTLFAAFQMLVRRWAGQDDFVVGSPIAGRPRTELEGMIGFFVNTLALRSDRSLRGGGEPTFTELLAGVRDHVLDAYEHQDLPFERLVDRLAPRRDLARQPLAQVVLALQNAPLSQVALPGVTLTGIEELGPPAARFDLTVDLREMPDGLRVAWVYPVALFEDATIERLARAYGELLEAVAADPGRPVSELPVPALAGLPERRPVSPLPGEEIERLRAGGRRDRLSDRSLDRAWDPAGGPLGAPRSPLEEAVAEVWREVLGLDELGIHEDFFDLGGHSLLATQVLAHLKERLDPSHREISLADLFEAPTVAGLCERIVQREAEEVGDEELAELLAEIDDLGEDEVEDLLREKEEV